MTKNSLKSSLKNIQLEEDWSSHPAIEWLIAHKKILLWTIFALIALLILASRLLAMRTLNAESDYFQARADFTQFQESAKVASTENPSADANENLEQLIAIMQRHPELKPKYEGALAQTLLIEGKIPLAQSFIQDISHRTPSDHLRLYENYTQTSILISEGRYADAILQTEQLKSALDQLNEKENPLLYVFNLIRLALLYQQTGATQQELKTWEELENQPHRMEAVLAASESLQTGQASLSQYIADRKNALMPH
jgi:hypothetical protein